MRGKTRGGKRASGKHERSIHSAIGFKIECKVITMLESLIDVKPEADLNMLIYILINCCTDERVIRGKKSCMCKISGEPF